MTISPAGGNRPLPLSGSSDDSEQVEIGRTIKKIAASKIPLISISFPTQETIKKKMKEGLIPITMRLSALSMSMVKALANEGKIKNIQPAMTGFGTFALGFEGPLAVWNTYSLVKNWKEIGKGMKVKMGGMILSGYLMTAAGVAFIISTVPLFAKKLGMMRSMQAMHIGMGVLGPIGMGIMALLNLGTAASLTKKAAQSELQRREVLSLKKNAKEDFSKSLLELEKNRHSAHRNLSLMRSFKFILLGAGVGLGAIAMSSVIVALAATPVFWVSVGAIGVSFAISLTIQVYQDRRSKKKEALETENIVEEIVKMLPKGLPQSPAILRVKELGEQILEQVEDTIKFLMKDEDASIQAYFQEKRLRSLLTESGWPGNPPLIELIAAKILEGE